MTKTLVPEAIAGTASAVMALYMFRPAVDLLAAAVAMEIPPMIAFSHAQEALISNIATFKVTAALAVLIVGLYVIIALYCYACIGERVCYILYDHLKARNLRRKDTL